MVESISSQYTGYAQAMVMQQAQTMVLAKAIDSVQTQGEAVVNLISAATPEQVTFSDPMMGQYVNILV